MVTAPNILDPLNSPGADPRGNLYLLDPNLRAPYEQQYNFTWEPDLSSKWQLQLGMSAAGHGNPADYVDLNRAVAVPGIPQTTATINARRPDQRYADIRWVLNGSRAYFDAARVALMLQQWKGLSMDAAYWFSKAIDLGSAYSGTAYDVDSRLSRSQSMFETQKDMRAVSTFDQPHAFLIRAGYLAPARLGHWNLSSVVLLNGGRHSRWQRGLTRPVMGTSTATAAIVSTR